MNLEETRAKITAFLACRRVAVVGVSRDPKAYSNGLFRDLRDRGYDVVPVNPHAAELEGAKVFPTVAAIAPAVEAAMVCLPAAAAEKAARDCADAGIKRVWFTAPGKAKAEYKAAVDFCEGAGVSVIPGFCPNMYLEKPVFVHRIHGFLAKAFGRAPK